MDRIRQPSRVAVVYGSAPGVGGLGHSVAAGISAAARGAAEVFALGPAAADSVVASGRNAAGNLARSAPGDSFLEAGLYLAALAAGPVGILTRSPPGTMGRRSSATDSPGRLLSDDPGSSGIAALVPSGIYPNRVRQSQRPYSKFSGSL